MPAGLQLEAATMTYMRRPAVDAAGKATGGMEIVPAPPVPPGNPNATSVSSSVVATSQALSRAVGKAGAVANQPGAVPDKGEAALDPLEAERKTAQASSSRAGASSSSPGAGQGAAAAEDRKRSKLERSSSWKTG